MKHAEDLVAAPVVAIDTEVDRLLSSGTSG